MLGWQSLGSLAGKARVIRRLAALWGDSHLFSTDAFSLRIEFVGPKPVE
jgi:hypothetical protein